MVKYIVASKFVDVPEKVKVAVNARNVTVEGPRGKLTRDFKHVRCDLAVVDGGKKVRVDMWFGNKKELSSATTISAHIKNMIVGVTKGFRYRMRLVHAHFPINVNMEGDKVEVRNYIGERRLRGCTLMPGVSIKRTAGEKDSLELEGNDVEAVGTSAARVWQSARVTDKDIRKFLDGIYVYERGNVVNN